MACETPKNHAFIIECQTQYVNVQTFLIIVRVFKHATANLMDALGDILRIIRLQGSVYFNACFCSPWGLSMEQSNHSMFHIIVRGDAWLQMASQFHHPLRL